MSAGPSRSRVTRVELTADQLLGSDLTPARLQRQRKNAPKVVTVEQLLGPSLTIAGPSSRSSSRAATRAPSSPRQVPPAPRPIARCPSPSRIAVPHRERVTADEVLRTGLPLRTLQAAKARARNAQAMVLTAEQLHASGTGSGSSSSSGSRLSSPSPRNRSRPRVVTAEELAGPGPETSLSSSARRPGSAGGNPAAVSHTSGVRSGASTSRISRPSTAGAAIGSGSASAGGSAAAGSSGTAGRRASRSGRIQRSSSQGSTRTLPMYTKEPGESEVVIDRSTEELEDEIPITVMTPVTEDGSSLANGLPDSAGPSSPVSPASPRGADSSHIGRPLRPLDAISPIPIPISPVRTILNQPVASVLYADEVPSYEAAISMNSSPDLVSRIAPADIPLPASPQSPALPPRSPVLSIPGRSGAPSPSSPSSPGSAFGSSNPPSPSEGAESPRKRFPFMSLFPSHGGGSSSRSRIRGGSVSGLPSPTATAATMERPVSPSPPSPRPLHRSSHSASGSMLDLLSRSWSDNPAVRYRSDRSGA
ncbi:hypothetical protein C8Q80DRAFT_1147723 [Daedaleopsis nitida]|nr:hypothetical protein C8Q80DRAFT_1147723 [Daedaleopsis nitida]